MPEMDRKSRAYSALIVGVIAISWSAIFVRWTHIPGVASAFYRVVFAAMSLWPVLLLSKTRPARIKRSAVCIAAIGGVFFAGDVALYNIAVLHTSAGNATFLSNNAPMFVGLLSWTVTRKMPSRMFWMALAIALSGSFLIVVVDAKNINPASSADELAVAASVCFALYLMATERLRGTCESLMLLTLSTTASAGALLIAAVLTHVSLRIPDTSSFASLLGLALICQIAGYFSLTYSLGHLPATVTSVTLLAVAPLTSLLALTIFREHMSQLQITGGMLVLMGVWMANRLQQNGSLSSAVSQAD